MIYYGYNRLENWLIDQCTKPLDIVRHMLEPEMADVPQSIQDVMVPELSARRSESGSFEEIDAPEFNAWHTIGTSLVRAGTAILLVPDPLPVVDEVIGFSLIVGGVLIIALS